MPQSFVNGYVDGTKLVFLEREGGQLRRREVSAEYAAYFREDELPDDLRRGLTAGAMAMRPEPGGWLRVGWNDGEVRKNVCYVRSTKNRFTQEEHVNPLLERGIRHYEADLDPVRRWMVDNTAHVVRPRRAYIDIETDSRVPFSKKEEMRVLCWSLSDDTRTVEASVLHQFTDQDEKRVLGELWEALNPYDQVVAWYGDGFDFPVIWARSECTGIRGIDPRRWNWTDHMVAFKRMNMHVAESGDEKQSFSLQNIGMSVIGRGKAEFDASKTYEAWEAGGERRRQMVAYNIDDTLLMPDIEKKTGYLDLFSTICEVCHLFPSTESLNPTVQMDGFMLSLAKERGHHFKSREWRTDEEMGEQAQKFKGADVMQPKSLDPAWRKKRGMSTGILRDVHVADFASLYPSIILTWNMSPDTIADGAINGPIPEGMCRCPMTGTTFNTGTMGLLPIAIAELIRLRKQWNDLKSSLPPGTPAWHDADKRSMAYKVAANSFFGVMGSPFSRFFDRRVAEGITQNGAWLIRQTASAAENRGWQVVYVDTDSIFVIGCTKDEFSAFVQLCNATLYPEALKKVGCTENHIKLAYEKAFDRVCFTAAKKYVGTYSHYKGKAATADSKPEIKGLEYKRGDATLYARTVQKETIGLILAGELEEAPYHDILLRARMHVLEDPLELAEVKQAKGLNKSLRDYVQKKKADGTDAAQPPHVAVAKILKERGRDVQAGTKIEFVVVDDLAEDASKRFIPAEDFKGECDRHYVWESLVYPPTYRLLMAAFPEQAAVWERWARSRPKKIRGRRAPGKAEGQESFLEMV